MNKLFHNGLYGNSIPLATVSNLVTQVGATSGLCMPVSQQNASVNVNDMTAYSPAAQKFDREVQELMVDYMQRSENIASNEEPEEVVVDDMYVNRACAEAEYAPLPQVFPAGRAAYQRLDETMYTLDIDYNEA